MISLSLISVKWSNCNELRMGAKSLWGDTAQNVLKFVENIPDSRSFAKLGRIKKGKTISRHTIVKLLKVKIKKKMSAGGRGKTYIKQKGAIIWKMTS